MIKAQDATTSKLPLVVANAEETRVVNASNQGAYNTYNTDSGPNNSADDAPVKDED